MDTRYKSKICYLMTVLALATACSSHSNAIKNNIRAPIKNDIITVSSGKGLEDLGLSEDRMELEMEMAEAQDKTLAEFHTSFKDGTWSRIRNITLASIAVDGTVIQPGEVFSFNETVGPTTKARGFALGKVFFKGKEQKGYGGGVCQVSSTIYNSALMANMEIVERHAHSKPVYYVEQGKDATTSYGGKDFKFKNNKPYPIRINSYLYDQNVYVAIERA